MYIIKTGSDTVQIQLGSNITLIFIEKVAADVIIIQSKQETPWWYIAATNGDWIDPSWWTY